MPARIAFLCALVFTPPAAAQPKKSVYTDLLPSVVRIREPNGGTGTGWVLDTGRRLVVTNYHVVADGARPRTANGYFAVHDDVVVWFPARDAAGKLLVQVTDYPFAKAVKARVLDADSRTDLALLQVEALPPGARALKIAAADPEPGDAVHTIGGKPAGSAMMWPYAQGYVRQVGRRAWTTGGGASFYSAGVVVQSQMPTNPGNSGGPVVSDAGELVGVNQSGNTGTSLNNNHVGAAMVREFLETALHWVDPKTAIEVGGRGSHYEATDRLALAEADYRKALELAPKSGPLAYASPKIGLASVLSRTGRHDDALKLASEVVAADRTSAVAAALRGRIWLRKIQAERVNPFGAKSLIPVETQTNAVRDDCLRALELDPKYAAAHEVLADFYATSPVAAERSEEKELEHRTRAVDLRPAAFDPLLKRAECYARSTKLGEKGLENAIVDCTRALALIDGMIARHWPNVAHKVPALRQAVGYLIRSKNFAKLEELTGELVELEPENAENQFLHGSALVGQRKFAAALGSLTEAIRLTVQTGVVPPRRYYVRRGDAYAGAGVVGPARQDYELALRIPDAADFGGDDPDGVSAKAIREKIAKLPAK